MVSGGCVCGISLCYAEVVEVCGSICGHWNKIWWKTGGGEEVLLPGAGCPGLMARCPGHRMSGLEGWMSGVPDVLGVGPDVRALDPDELRMEGGKSGQNSEEFVDGNLGKEDGKLDLPATHESRGSNPTKLRHTNKSQKKLRAIFVGNF